MAKMDPNATAFDPTSFGGGADGTTATNINYQQLRQEELFMKLQNMNTAKSQLKYQIDNVLMPALNNLNQQMQFAHAQQWNVTNPFYYSQLFQNQQLMLTQVHQQNAQYQLYEQTIIQLQNVYQHHKY
eukprot:316817_1